MQPRHRPPSEERAVGKQGHELAEGGPVAAVPAAATLAVARGAAAARAAVLGFPAPSSLCRPAGSAAAAQGVACSGGSRLESRAPFRVAR
jgi:hypothetical protein